MITLPVYRYKVINVENFSRPDGVEYKEHQINVINSEIERLEKSKEDVKLFSHDFVYGTSILQYVEYK